MTEVTVEGVTYRRGEQLKAIPLEGYVNKKAELFKGMRYAKIQRIAEGLD